MTPWSYALWMLRNWAVIAIFTLVGVAVALALSLSARTMFTATSELFLSTPRFGNISLPPDSPFLADGFAQQRARSYVRLASRVDLARRVVQKLGIDLAPEKLAAATTAWTPPDTVMIDLAVSASSPEDAKILTDAVTAELAADIRSLESRSGQVIPVVEPVVTNSAQTPSKPSSPNIIVYLLFGTSMGFLAGVTAAAFLHWRRLDTNELERITRRPVLGVVVVDQGSSGSRSVDPSPTNSAKWQWTDVLRKLAVETDRAGDRVLAVTSENGSETSSFVAAGLASACARAGSRAVLVLGRPLAGEESGNNPTPTRSVHSKSSEIGLADLIVGTSPVDDALLRTDNDNLYCLPRADLDSVAPIVASERFQTIVGELRESFDVVILDVPRLFELIPCTPISGCIDSVVLVVPETALAKGDIESGLRVLRDKKVRLLGSISIANSFRSVHALDSASAFQSREGTGR